MTNLIARGKALIERWRASRLGRANERFGASGGSVLSGGIAYTALLSLFALLAIAFTVLLGVLRADRTLLAAVTRSVNSWVPGLLAGDGGSGLIDPASLVLAPALSLAGVVSVLVLAWSALALSRGLRSALDAIADRPPDATSFVRGLLRDVGLVAALGLGLVATSGLQLLAWEAGPALDGLPDGWRGIATIALRVATFLLAALIDAAVIAYLLWPFARPAPSATPTASTADGASADPTAAPPKSTASTADGASSHSPAARRDLLIAAAVAGVVFGIVRLLGVSIVAGAGANPLLAPFAALVTLLAWVNLNSRTVLYAAAWLTTTPVPALSGR